MKVALVHDWLTGMRGGERCLEAFVQMYPEADIFALVHIPGTTTSEIDARVKATSWLNRIPGIAKLYRALLPLFPFAIRSLDLRGYDLVISLSHAAAKNVRVPQGVPHICYCFTPMRYIWDQAPVYFRGMFVYLAQPLLWLLRRWDRAGASGVTEFVAISSFVAARIRRFYGRRATIIPPPVRMSYEIEKRLTSAELDLLNQQTEPFFLCAGALVPYKRVDVAIEACNRLKVPLWILGKGPERASLEAKAGPTVTFFGHVSESFLWEAYRRCRALLFPGIEDFGIVPVECLSSGRPVIAIQAGGVSETVDGISLGSPQAAEVTQATGVMIPKSASGSAERMAEAIEFFCAHSRMFPAEAARQNAQRFDYATFFQSWRRFAEQVKISPGRVPQTSTTRWPAQAGDNLEIQDTGKAV
jgi:glycosyltransferase involved in cell wall biosynthesis